MNKHGKPNGFCSCGLPLSHARIWFTKLLIPRDMQTRLSLLEKRQTLHPLPFLQVFLRFVLCLSCHYRTWEGGAKATSNDWENIDRCNFWKVVSPQRICKGEARVGIVALPLRLQAPKELDVTLRPELHLSWVSWAHRKGHSKRHAKRERAATGIQLERKVELDMLWLCCPRMDTSYEYHARWMPWSGIQTKSYHKTDMAGRLRIHFQSLLMNQCLPKSSKELLSKALPRSQAYPGSFVFALFCR